MTTTQPNVKIIIGNKTFNNYSEYEKEYQKEWDRVYKNAPCNLNWVKEDWNYRLLKV